MMRSEWKVTAVAAVLMMALSAAACGGKGAEKFGNNSNSDDPSPSESPGPGGQPALIEFVAPSNDDPPASDGSTVFQPVIGPIGTGNPQGSLVRFRVLNALGQPARNNLRVLLSLEGPADATLTLTKDHTKDGIVETVVRAGATSGNAVVVAQVSETNLIARSAVISIGRPAGTATSVQFLQLRLPHVFDDVSEDEGTPQQRTQLGIRGSGLQAVDVVFVVLDEEGGPAADGTLVDFSLFGPNGGEFITPTSVASSKGFVSATVNTGTRPGPVEVTAQVRGTSIRARAIPLTIGGSLNPVASHLSIGSRCLNAAGRVIHNLRFQIGVNFSDQFNNEIPIGSAVSFFTEGGGIGAQGISEDGFEANADLITQDPIPANGRITVMAVTTGQESYTDLNGNNRFDPGEPFTDLPAEVFLDANEDGIYNLGEFFLDTNNNGVYDAAPNLHWDDQVLIKAEIPIIFSGATQISIDPQGFDLGAGETQVFTLFISDDLGNPLVGGTRVEISTNHGAVSPQSFGIPGTSVDTSAGPVPGVTAFQVFLTNTATEPTGEDAVPLVSTPTTLTINVISPINLDGTDCGGNGSVTASVTGFMDQ